MSRSATRARAGRDRTSLYEEITDKIIAELEAGRVPWVQPWGTVAAKASLTMPKNAATHRQYSGINVLILWGAVIERGFSIQNWLTFRQALGLGGNVRKGEHGTTVVYADRFVPDEECRRAEGDGDEPNAIPFLKRFTVFNTDQCKNLPRELTSAPARVPEGLILPHAEALIAATDADFRIRGDRAFYSPIHDFIQVPRPEAYYEPISYRRGRTRFEGGRYPRDGSPATESVRSTRRGDTTMRMSDDPALRDYDDYNIGSILRGEGTAFLVDPGILFAAYDALGHDALDEEVSRTRQIDHWSGSDFDGVIMFGEGDAVQHAAGEESERYAHDNLNAVPQAASVASKAAA